MTEVAPLRWAWVLLAPLAPFVLSGAVRAATGTSIAVSLVLAVVGSGVLAAIARRAMPRLDRFTFVALVGGLLAGLALVALQWNRELGVLVTVGGGDAGNHVSLQHEFARDRHDVYQSFVTFYALVHWAKALLGTDDYGGFAAGFVVVLMVDPLCTAAVSAALARAVGVTSTKAFVVFAVIGVGLLGPVVVRLWGPWLHYQQADGFYAHLFGLVPVFAVWLAYAAATRWWWRVAILLAFVGLHRFTYGLNLGDWLVAAAGLIAIEARGNAVEDRRWRWALLGLAVALLAASVIAYRALWPLRLVEGALITGELRKFMWAQPVLLATIAAALLSWGRSRPTVAALLWPPLVFGAVAYAVQVAVDLTGVTHRYYFYKYGLHAMVWSSAAAIAIVPVAFAQLVSRASLRARLIALSTAGAGVVGVVLLMSGTRAYWHTFVERAFGHPPYERIDALADRALLQRVRAVLAEQGATSGTVLDPSWPRSNFMNATLGTFHAFKEGQQRFERPVVSLEPGHCVFWLEAEDVRRVFDALVEHTPEPRARWSELTGSAQKVCAPHLRPWRPDDPALLCHLCASAPK